ncbi:hypothetical protein [Acinetobacter baumannii]
MTFAKGILAALALAAAVGQASATELVSLFHPTKFKIWCRPMFRNLPI